MKKYIVILIASIALAACEKEYTWDFQQSNSQLLVVDGMITNELRSHCIILSRTNADINVPVDPISMAMVSVTDGDSIYGFTESIEQQGYYYSLPFQAVAGKTYELTVRIDTQQYHALDAMVAVSPLTNLQYLPDTTNLLRVVPVTQGSPAMTDIYYNWSADSSYSDQYGSSTARETHFIINSVDANKIFAPDKAVILFPHGTLIVRRKHSLSDKYQEYLRSLLMETEWSGGVFDTQHGNLSTNLSAGAIGFFSVCAMVSDTTVVE